MSPRSGIPQHQRPNTSFSSLCIYGLGAGVAGVAAMTLSQKIEQYFTSRPNSLVPGYTMQHLFGLAPRPEKAMFPLNMAMHYGQGAAAGIVRAIMSINGVQGPFATFIFVGIRLAIDQTLENWTGVGSLPWTWPVGEQIIDIFHKSVYALATGFLTDRFLS
ncbi:hypothetical protein FQN49_004018 [Arthroderma sp. PD_2]|nr:hypothetical protein FQN49_004018 [Arthroderma sp. PD_2]